MKPNMVFFRYVCYIWILLLSSITFTGQSANAQRPHRFKVYVGVTCDDKHTKSLIQSWTKRELRNLGDVVIIGFEDAEYILNIVAIEPVSQASGRKMGDISIGSVFMRKVPNTENHYYYPYSWVHSGSIDKHLEFLCKTLVASIDTTAFERVRYLFQ